VCVCVWGGGGLANGTNQKIKRVLQIWAVVLGSSNTMCHARYNQNQCTGKGSDHRQ